MNPNTVLQCIYSEKFHWALSSLFASDHVSVSQQKVGEGEGEGERKTGDIMPVFPFLLLGRDASVNHRDTMNQDLLHCKLVHLREMKRKMSNTFPVISHKRTLLWGKSVLFTLIKLCNVGPLKLKSTLPQITPQYILLPPCSAIKTPLQRPNIHMHVCAHTHSAASGCQNPDLASSLGHRHT